MIGVRRAIEPFSFFFGHASAIPGLGGSNRGPDPNYCFHTPYHEYQPGIVLFRVTITGAKASHGELAARVHAFRPDSGHDASLVTGSRTPLEGLAGEDLELVVRAPVVPGVQYALYGYFSEASDLRASGLSVTIEECGGDDPNDYVSSDTARSLFESSAIDSHHRLVADGPPCLAHPVSQPLTEDQLQSSEYLKHWLDLPAHTGETGWRWRQVFALQTLQTYGMLRSGPTGLLLTDEPLPLGRLLRAQGCSLAETGVSDVSEAIPADGACPHRAGGIPSEEIGPIGGQFDFLIAMTKPDWFVDKAGFHGFVSAGLRRLLRGGIAVFLFDFTRGRGHRSDGLLMSTGHIPDRQEIEQLAMRIISHGSDVAQLSFGVDVDGHGPLAEICPFGLIVRR